MNINRDKHNKYVAGWTPNITTSTGSETSSGSTSTIIYVGGGGSSSGGDSGTVTQQNTFLYYIMSDGTNSITQTATIPTDTAILTLIGKNGVTVTASQEKSIPETEFVSTGTNTGTYKISYNKLVTTPDPTEEVPEPQPVTTYPVTITYVSGDKILTSSFDTLTLYNTVDETEQVVATYNQTQLQIDGDTTGINSIVADANNTVFSRITLSITVEEQTTIVLDFAVTVNQQDILYVEGTQTEQYWKLDDDGNLYTTYNAYSTQELSAYGIGESEGTPTTGAEYLYQLKDVSDAVQTPIDKGILQYNATTSQWEVTDGSNITPDLTGYAKEDWVTQQITNQINILKGNAPENMDTLGEIAGVISSLSDKVTSLEVLLEWFEWDDANDAIKALFDLYGVGEISAYGYNTQEQPVGAQYLNDLLDVTISNPTNNQILIYNGSQWVNQVLPESGLNESELAQYLTEHNYVQSSALEQYATITQLNQEITNLIGGAPAELDTLGEIATVIQSLQQLLDWFSFVDGRIRANYDLWGVGEISAYGVGEGSSSGGKNYLHELEDVLLGDDLASGQLLQYNGTYWVNIDKDKVGLNETELANYLTQNNYLQQGDVTWSNLSGKPSTFNTTINQINDLNSSWDSLLLNPPTDYVNRWPAFSEVTDKPTTLAGYGITDAYTKTETDNRYVNITGDTMTGNLTLPALIANDYVRIGSTARLEYDSTNNAIKVTNASGGIVNFYATGEVSAYGMGSESTIVGYLDDLNDVTISNPTNGQALIFNGSQWVNQTIQQGLDEDALYDYLVENNYIQESDLSGYAKSVYVNGSQYNANSSGRITIPDYITRYSVDSDGTQVISTGLRLKDSSNYGQYLYFGDSNYVYLAELTDNDLTIHASDLNLDVDRLLVNGEELQLEIELTTSGSGNIVTNITASGNSLTVTKGFTIATGTSGRLAYYTGSTTIGSYSSTVGSTNSPVYINDGVPTAITYDLNGNLNAGTAGRLAYYSTNNSIDDYISTIGSGIKLWYLSSGVPTNSSSTIGSSTSPVYLSSGTITACAYDLSANVNSGTSNRLAYYSSATAIDDYTSTVGSNTRLWYLSSGTPTNSTSTIGSDYIPVFLSSGTITASSQEFMVNRGVLKDNWTNWDSALTAGMYSLSEWGTNGPSSAGYEYGTVAIFQSGSSSYGGAVSQLYMPHMNAGARVYAAWRTTYQESSSKWTNWHYLLDTGNYAYFLNNYYVKKSGDTMTGALTVPSLAVSGSTVVTDITMSGSLHVQYGGSNAASIYSNWEHGLVLGINGTLLEFTDEYCAPGNDTAGQYDLGLSNRRYGNVYAVNENLTGTLTVNGQATFNTQSVHNYGILTSMIKVNQYLEIGSGRLYWDSTNNALYVQKSDGSVCGFYATGFVSAYGTNDDVGGYYVQKSGDTMTGRLTISTSDNQQLYLNGTSQAQIAFRVNGTTQSLVGYSSTSGAFLQIGSHWINMRSDGTACVDNEYTIWHSGNDGSGSGLDADLLDGTHKSGLFTAMAYAGSTLSLTIGGVKKSVNIETSAVIPTVTVSSSSSRNLSVNVGGSTDYVNDLYATYLDGTTKQGLFTELTYSSNKLSVTIGGTTKSVTINAGSSGSYLPLSGGTISGNLKVNGQATFNTQSVHNYGILTSNISTNQSMYIRYGSADTARIYCNWASGMIISVDGANTEFTNTYIATGTTTASAFDLGTSNRRWRTIYSVNSLNTSSDLRLKDVRAAIPLTVAQVAAAPSFLYRWKKGADTALHAGSSAQYWQQALPQAVTEGADGYLAMEYDRIALAAAITTARAVETLDQRVTRLEKENAMLKQRLSDNKIRTN